MIFKIAFRNTLRQRRRSLLTALTMLGGFVLSALSIGWSEGSYNYVINMFTRNRLGHIQVHGKGYLDKPSLYNTVKDYSSIGKKIGELKQTVSWAPRLFTAGLASIGDDSSAVTIKGIDSERENKTTDFNKKIVKGKPFSSASMKQAMLGKGLADVFNADIGSEVVIVSQAADGSIANDLYTVRGIVESGDAMSDRTDFYLKLREAQNLFYLNNQVHEIAVVVRNLDKVGETADEIRQKIDRENVSVATWQEFASDFYKAMQADKQGMWVMLFVIVLIVAVGVLNTVLMSVLERTKEYGVLKAIGTKPKQIFLQVISEVNIIALASILAGTVISIGINYALSNYGIKMPFSFTYGGMEFNTMYTEVNFMSVYIPAITVMLSASVVSIFPALRAAKIVPVKAMRER
ncbi:MAG: ABC transporter permease [Elusimicrobiota bacterium]